LTFVLKRFWPALLLLLIVTVLLCLPASTLPKTGGEWFSKYYVDKIIHAIMFATLVYMFCRPVQLKGFLTNIITKIYFLITILFVVYGLIMELIQKWFIVGRSFEGLDILADAVGAFIGYFIAKSIVKKQKPPTQEELQNQLMDYAKRFVQK
jgi:VanZ family protein